MRFRNLDSNGDWEFGKGTNSYTFDSLAVALNIKTKILEWQNDCFFNLTAGIDWRSRLGLRNQKSFLDADIKRIVNDQIEVTQIVEFSSSLENGKYSAQIRYSDIYGTTNEVLV